MIQTQCNTYTFNKTYIKISLQTYLPTQTEVTAVYQIFPFAEETMQLVPKYERKQSIYGTDGDFFIRWSLVNKLSLTYSLELPFW